MKVGEIMTDKVEYIDHDANIYEAIEKMVDKRIRSLVVRPKDERDVYGVITVRDVVFKVIKKNLDLNKVKVEDIASKPLICVDEEMEMEHVVKLMEKFNIARIFVTRGRKVIGVVALLDVIVSRLIMKK
ncbi:MAG: CBS domain-containing protein [Candidatus Desulfofervidus auxilii]|nr:CBS domain-containing protein [Candidatus Desulfofervidus auxilii]